MLSLPAAVLLLLGAVPPGGPIPPARLLEGGLELPGRPLGIARPLATAPDLSVAARHRALAASEGGGGAEQEGRSGPGGEQKQPGAGRSSSEPGSLDFDLLGAPPATKPVDEGALRTRRTMLTWHQGVGLGMFALQLATTVVGQLNYGDKFGGDNTDKYVQPHAILAYSTLAAFVAAGALALFAPSPVERDEGFDRVTLHKIAMATATAGMVAQGVLGIWTRSREGYLNQQSIATAHLAIGYVTLAAVATGIGAIVF